MYSSRIECESTKKEKGCCPGKVRHRTKSSIRLGLRTESNDREGILSIMTWGNDMKKSGKRRWFLYLEVFFWSPKERRRMFLWPHRMKTMMSSIRLSRQKEYIASIHIRESHSNTLSLSDDDDGDSSSNKETITWTWRQQSQSRTSLFLSYWWSRLTTLSLVLRESFLFLSRRSFWCFPDHQLFSPWTLCVVYVNILIICLLCLEMMVTSFIHLYR